MIYTNLQFVRLSVNPGTCIFVSPRELSKLPTYESYFGLHCCARSIPKIEQFDFSTSRIFWSDSSYHGGLALFPRFSPSPTKLCGVNWYYSSLTLAMISRLDPKQAKSWILYRILTLECVNTRYDHKMWYDPGIYPRFILFASHFHILSRPSYFGPQFHAWNNTSWRPLLQS